MTVSNDFLRSKNLSRKYLLMLNMRHVMNEEVEKDGEKRNEYVNEFQTVEICIH